MKQNKNGFTLVEVMMVVGILGIIASLATLGVRKSLNNGRIKEAENHVIMIGAAVEQLAWDTGKLPNKTARTKPGSLEIWDISSAFAGLVDNDGSYSKWKGPYYTDEFIDPWGNPYFFDPDYRVNGKMVAVVGSFGPNGKGRNMYDEDDIFILVND